MRFPTVIHNFGSMENINSALGEMFHKTETKDPSQTTQRRKDNFELQTAWRYVENLIISEGNDDTKDENSKDRLIDEHYKRKIIYSIKKGEFQKMGRNHKYVNVEWEDYILVNGLKELLNRLINDGCVVNNDVELFTQVNYMKTIFRGDPSFDLNRPWYDWALVDWGERIKLFRAKF